jgi:hypothetical protein
MRRHPPARHRGARASRGTSASCRESVRSTRASSQSSARPPFESAPRPTYPSCQRPTRSLSERSPLCPDESSGHYLDRGSRARARNCARASSRLIAFQAAFKARYSVALLTPTVFAITASVCFLLAKRARAASTFSRVIFRGARSPLESSWKVVWVLPCSGHLVSRSRR